MKNEFKCSVLCVWKVKICFFSVSKYWANIRSAPYNLWSTPYICSLFQTEKKTYFQFSNTLRRAFNFIFYFHIHFEFFIFHFTHWHTSLTAICVEYSCPNCRADMFIYSYQHDIWYNSPQQYDRQWDTHAPQK